MFRIDESSYVAEPITDTDVFMHGIGLCEVIRLSYDEQRQAIRAEFLAEHYRRLLHGIEVLGLKVDFCLYTLEQAVRHIVVTEQPKFGLIKVVIAAIKYPQCQVFFSYEPTVIDAEAYQKGYRLSLSHVKRNPCDPYIQLKTTSNVANLVELMQAKARGIDEMLHVNTYGYIADCCCANVFWQYGRVLFTPSPECGVLPGIMRKQTIERYHARGYLIREGMYELNDIYAADRIFLTSCALGEMPAYIEM